MAKKIFSKTQQLFPDILPFCQKDALFCFWKTRSILPVITTRWIKSVLLPCPFLTIHLICTLPYKKTPTLIDHCRHQWNKTNHETNNGSRTMVHVYLMLEFRLRDNIKHNDAIKAERKEQPRTTINFTPSKHHWLTWMRSCFTPTCKNYSFVQCRGINK